MAAHTNHSAEATIRFFFTLLIIFILALTALTYNRDYLFWLFAEFPPFRHLYRYSYPLFKPLYQSSFITIGCFIVFSWLNAAMTTHKPMNPEKGYTIGGYSIIPNNQNLIIVLNLISISLNFLLFYFLKQIGSSNNFLYWTCFIIFFLSVIATFILPVVLQKTIVYKPTLHESSLAKRFEQNKEKHDTKDSIWWKTEAGYCYVQNPYRGICIIGGPGAGKSYTIIEPIISQFLEKNASALIYDFKFPVLSTYTYNVYKNLPPENQPALRTIYFKDVRYSHRCNPLDPRIMNAMTKANEASMTILYNINKTWAEKSGDFWSENAINTLTAIMWWLRCISVDKNINVSTLPHAIEICCYDDIGKLIDLLIEHPEASVAMSATKTAHKNQAAEQLAGQLSTLQNAMTRIADKNIYWVMSGNDFTLDINNPKDPKILLLGNDDLLKKTFAPALSLYASTVAGLINNKGLKECAFIIDELPTLYIDQLDNLPNTGRSNKIATIIGMQDKAQLNLKYGDKAAKVLLPAFGNMFVGQTSDAETSKLACEMVGKQVMTRKNVNTGHDVSVSFNEHTDLIIQPFEMGLLNKGVFVGKTSDPMTADDESEKRFAALFNVKKPSWYSKPEPMPKVLFFPELSEEEEIKKVEKIVTDNHQKIRKEVASLIETEYWKLKITKYLQFGDEQTKFFYKTCCDNNTIESTVKHYADQAIELYNTFLNSPAISGDLNKKVLTAIVELIGADIMVNTSTSDDDFVNSSNDEYEAD